MTHGAIQWTATRDGNTAGFQSVLPQPYDLNFNLNLNLARQILAIVESVEMKIMTTRAIAKLDMEEKIAMKIFQNVLLTMERVIVVLNQRQKPGGNVKTGHRNPHTRTIVDTVLPTKTQNWSPTIAATLTLLHLMTHGVIQWTATRDGNTAGFQSVLPQYLNFNFHLNLNLARQILAIVESVEMKIMTTRA